MQRVIFSIRSKLTSQLRHLHLQEHHAKKILSDHGVRTQRFKLVTNAQDAKLFVQDQSWKPEEFVVKAQILAGGRGKGVFKGSALNGVILTHDRQEASDLSCQMLGDRLVTKQTPPDGVLVEKVMIAEAVDLAKQFYFSIILDPSYDEGLIFMTCPHGGMDIENHSELIKRFTIPIDMELDFDASRRMVMAAFDLNLHDLDIIDQCAREIMKLHNIFLKLDALQIEINPLGVTKDLKVLCVDAKMDFDESARFRQKWLEQDGKNLNFIALDGDIGCLVNGAGLAMATMDILKLHGGEPANFLDVGGGATAKQVTEAFRIISSDPKVQAIFVNIFGGIMRCDVIAEGIIQAADTLKLTTPIICRLQGTRAEDAQALIHASDMRIHAIDDLDEAAKLAVRVSQTVSRDNGKKSPTGKGFYP